MLIIVLVQVVLDFNVVMFVCAAVRGISFLDLVVFIIINVSK